MRTVAALESMRADSARLRAARPNPFMVGGKVDCDRVMGFLTDYNELLNHPMKPHRTFIEKDMKL
jgi:hypothetical protein